VTIKELEQAVAAVDRLDWRIAFDGVSGYWEAWFHPDWEADPRKVAVYLSDSEPSANEQAAMKALQLALEKLPALTRVAREAMKVVEDDRDPPFQPGFLADLVLALADLEDY